AGRHPRGAPMSAGLRLRRWIRETPPAGVHSLMTLRALVAGADGRSAVRWEELAEEYQRLYGPEDATLPASGLEALAEQGLIARPAVFEEEAGPEGRWREVRLSPQVHGDLLEAHMEGVLPELIAEMDQAIALYQDGRNGGPAAPAEAPPPSAAAPVRVAAPSPDGSGTLHARGLVKSYRKRRVVNQVDVQVSQGEIVGLLGPNGAGKTTTFYMMVGLISPDAGRVHLGKDDITRVPMYRRARRGIGYLAQEPSVFRRLTVEENILAVLQMMKLPRAEQRRRLEELLDELHIKHLRTTRAYALSGGERRRLEITRALVGRPQFMLLDEPFAGVDPIAVHDIQQIVSDLRRRGIGVLISDHNVEQTLDIVDRAYIMYDGRVRVAGTVSELVWNEEVAEIYLGPTLTARMRERYPIPETDDAE
ncbi:MAG TPA: LPS export ABC transporter ATP-binding protein, partial [Longimicrobiaceae bacterium]|nr:LPS export ABC transporter ATP-binding protein [Longimicrobiaceae bacterium]